MKRNIEDNLYKWKENPRRKPIILRGARQVGKTYIIRELGKTFENFVEINFEKTPNATTIFESDFDIKRIIRDLSILSKTQIQEKKTLLFLDEIQIAPKAISAIRYFYEDMPNLHVIAAGSLIDFELENISVPVGRVSYLTLYPLSFLEFLRETESPVLVDTLNSINFSQNHSPIINHDRLLSKLSEYLAIGGMPDVVKTWVETSDLGSCRKIQLNIVNSYKDDFKKYAKHFQLNYIENVFDSIPQLLGQKVKYSNISEVYKARELAPCLDLLVKAGVIHKVFQSSSQTPPLGAKINKEQFKAIFLDIGLAQAILGLEIGDWILNPKLSIENKGDITEAFVGQEILAYANPEEKKQLYYWHRDKGSSKAEIDYVIQRGEELIPIEVKGGKTGSRKSLISYIKNIERSARGVYFSQKQYERKPLYSMLPIYLVNQLFQKDSLNKHYEDLQFKPGDTIKSSEINKIFELANTTAKLFKMEETIPIQVQSKKSISPELFNTLINFINGIYHHIDKDIPEWKFKPFKSNDIIKPNDFNEIVQKLKRLRLF
ncbi:ATP-binding protein [bacterium]|nr:ATP-binding protein [bacterium]